jgi:hypothetical protein
MRAMLGLTFWFDDMSNATVWRTRHRRRALVRPDFENILAIVIAIKQ